MRSRRRRGMAVNSDEEVVREKIRDADGTR